jgi:Na+-translocating ferredoxin:NAD+ oxidoreductase RnfC subunit
MTEPLKPAFKLYTAICKTTGCKAAAEAQGWERGEKTVCRNCQQCALHCPCDCFDPAYSWLDIKAAQAAIETSE